MKRLIRNFIRKYQDIILPVVILALAVSAIVFGIVPAGSQVLDLWGKVSDTRENISSLSRKRAFLDSQNEFDLQNQLKTVVSAVPRDKSVPSVLGVVDSLSNQAGVTLVNFTLVGAGSLSTESAKLLTAEEKALGVSSLPFLVTISGPFSGVRAFIASATQVRRLVKFSNFDVSIVSSVSATMRANLSAFYVSLPQLPLLVEQSLPLFTTEDNATIAKLSSYNWLTEQTLALPPGGPGVGRADPFSY